MGALVPFKFFQKIYKTFQIQCHHIITFPVDKTVSKFKFLIFFIPSFYSMRKSLIIFTKVFKTVIHSQRYIFRQLKS